MAKELTIIEQKGLQLRDHLFAPKTVAKIKGALQGHLSEEHLLRLVMNTAMRNPRILECSIESILQSVMQCAILGLEPIQGRAYLVPYNNSKQVNGRWTKVMECQMQPGYVGLIDLARRSGKVRSVFGAVVHDNDHFVYQLGSDRKLEHRPILRGPAGEPMGAYAFWDMNDGGTHMDFMPMEEIYKRRDRSQAYRRAIKNPGNKFAQDTPWLVWHDEMCIKTVIKHSSKMVPASISMEFDQAMDMDNAVDVGARYNPFDGAATQIPERGADEWARDFDFLVEKEIAPGERAAFDSFLSALVEKDGRGELVVKAEIMSADDWGACLDSFRSAAGPAGAGSKTPPGPGTTTADMQRDRRRGVGNPAYNGPPEGFDMTGKPKGDPAWARDKWWNLRAGSLENNTGLWSYVVAHRHALSAMPMNEFGELAKKFQGLYKKPFPYTPDGEIDGGGGDDRSTRGGDSDPGVGADLQQALALLESIRGRYPKASQKILGDSIPGDVTGVALAIEQIEKLGEFTSE